MTNTKMMVRCLISLLFLMCATFSVGYAADKNDDSEPSFPSAFSITGSLKNETAYRLSEPNEFTKIKTILSLEGRYKFTPALKMKVKGRTFYDTVFALRNFPQNVRDDQEHEVTLREAFLDLSYRSLDLRLGLQQIVWGEAVVFIADVVNPRDLREFLLPDFEYIRIPIWAVDANYRLLDELSMEIVWTPAPQVDRLPVSGSEFEFFRPPLQGIMVVTEEEEKPTPSLHNSEIGVRLSGFAGGWDYSLFYLYTFDGMPVHFKALSTDPINGLPIVTISPKHPRQQILGGGFAKAFTSVVIKGEGAAFLKRSLELEDPQAIPGVVKKDVIDYVIGLGYTFPQDIHLEVQFLQEIIPEGKGLLLRDPLKSSFSVKASRERVEARITPEILLIFGVNDRDYQVSAKITINISDAVTLSSGVDIFGGPIESFYGQFAKKDRATLTLKYRF